MLTLAAIFITVSQTFSLPTGLLSALCHVESSHDTKVIRVNDGGSSSIGVCQVKLASARLLGFKGTESALRIPKVNVYFAGKYLHYQLSRYHSDVYKAIAAYNAGSHKVNKEGLTRNKKYVDKVFDAWLSGK